MSQPLTIPQAIELLERISAQLDHPDGIERVLQAIGPLADPSLAVLSTSEREQALEHMYQSALSYSQAKDKPAAVKWEADARRLLKLPPAEPQP